MRMPPPSRPDDRRWGVGRPARPAADGVMGVLPAVVLLAGLAWVTALALPGWNPGRPDTPTGPPMGAASTAGADAEAVADPAAAAFSAAYWAAPIPPQGAAPESIAPPARGIAPEDCGKCHEPQYQDWRGSRHAMAMGPGVRGQFPEFDVAGRAQCLTCHAPLSEQWKALPAPEGAAAEGDGRTNPAFVPALEGRGLTCAACHLRRHVRHAPPLTADKAAAQPKGVPFAGTLIHGEPVRTAAFLASEFCMGCHQHGPDTLHVNGKAIENTYREWLASPAAEQGRTCQSCHMPGGRHLWRGIHDPETTRAGVTVEARVTPEAPKPGESVTARLTLTNSGVGHAFPTYTTPAVYLRAALLDAQGRVLPGRFAERTLERRLNLGTRPWSEDYDTRLLPGATAVLEFAGPVPPEAATLYLWVWVEPDRFYAAFFRERLAAGASPTAKAPYREALARAQSSGYLLFGRRVPVSR